MVYGRVEFKELLRKKGLKITNQRLLVLEALASSPDRHMTVEEIYEMVRAGCPEIGMATVYRTIQLLLELQLIERINLDDGYVRYEIGDIRGDSAKHRHHHLICLGCGDIVSFQDDLLEEFERNIKETMSFTVTDHEVKLYGYCEKCGGISD